MFFDISIRKRWAGRELTLSLHSDRRLTALVGASGAGKTTVLNMIAGLIRPDAGRIVVGGATLFDPDRGIDLPPDRRGVGYVFQDNRLFPHMTVARNLRYGARRAGAGNAGIDEATLLDVLGIGHLLDRAPPTLSGGEARRVAIGRALLSRPRLLLLDEPLTSLDAARADDMLTAIERIRDYLSVPILYVSHNPAEIARLTDRVAELT